MKKGLLLSVVILLSASVAFAQLPGGAIGIYSDDVGSNCNFSDAGGVVSFHFYHLASPGATAIEFQLDTTGFPYDTHYGDASPFILKVGIFHTGVSLSYGGCLMGNIYLGSSNFGPTGGTAACTRVYIKPHPNPGQPGPNPLAASCQGQFVEVWGGSGTFNNDGSCPCTGSVPAQESSWGQIKALYN